MNRPLIVIVGETASGKSALAMDVAEAFDGEIVSADSWTVYRGFDIGTAKPSAKDIAAIPHHLLDIAGPEEGFNAALFQRLAIEAIDDIHARGRLPVLVGGTGLYVDSVLYGYGFLETPDPAVRRELEGMTLDELYAVAAERELSLDAIDRRNKRRVIRLIESGGVIPERQTLRPNTCVMGMRIPPEELESRITRRVDEMLSAGLEFEVASLAQAYGWHVEAMKGIGYREWREYFEGSQTLAETRERIIRSTLQLAKKQRTWFRRNNSIRWVSHRSYVVEIVTTFLNK